MYRIHDDVSQTLINTAKDQAATVMDLLYRLAMVEPLIEANYYAGISAVKPVCEMTADDIVG